MASQACTPVSRRICRDKGMRSAWLVAVATTKMSKQYGRCFTARGRFFISVIQSSSTNSWGKSLTTRGGTSVVLRVGNMTRGGGNSPAVFLRYVDRMFFRGNASAGYCVHYCRSFHGMCSRIDNSCRPLRPSRPSRPSPCGRFTPSVVIRQQMLPCKHLVARILLE
jgi:hypothetical protein